MTEKPDNKDDDMHIPVAPYVDPELILEPVDAEKDPLEIPDREQLSRSGEYTKLGNAVAESDARAAKRAAEVAEKWKSLSGFSNAVQAALQSSRAIPARKKKTEADTYAEYIDMTNKELRNRILADDPVATADTEERSSRKDALRRKMADTFKKNFGRTFVSTKVETNRKRMSGANLDANTQSDLLHRIFKTGKGRHEVLNLAKQYFAKQNGFERSADLAGCPYPHMQKATKAGEDFQSLEIFEILKMLKWLKDPKDLSENDERSMLDLRTMANDDFNKLVYFMMKGVRHDDLAVLIDRILEMEDFERAVVLVGTLRDHRKLPETHRKSLLRRLLTGIMRRNTEYGKVAFSLVSLEFGQDILDKTKRNEVFENEDTLPETESAKPKAIGNINFTEVLLDRESFFSDRKKAIATCIIDTVNNEASNEGSLQNLAEQISQLKRIVYMDSAFSRVRFSEAGNSKKALPALTDEENEAILCEYLAEEISAGRWAHIDTLHEKKMLEWYNRGIITDEEYREWYEDSVRNKAQFQKLAMALKEDPTLFERLLSLSEEDANDADLELLKSMKEQSYVFGRLLKINNRDLFNELFPRSAKENEAEELLSSLSHKIDQVAGAWKSGDYDQALGVLEKALYDPENGLITRGDDSYVDGLLAEIKQKLEPKPTTDPDRGKTERMPAVRDGKKDIAAKIKSRKAALAKLQLAKRAVPKTTNPGHEDLQKRLEKFKLPDRSPAQAKTKVDLPESFAGAVVSPVPTPESRAKTKALWRQLKAKKKGDTNPDARPERNGTSVEQVVNGLVSPSSPNQELTTELNQVSENVPPVKAIPSGTADTIEMPVQNQSDIETARTLTDIDVIPPNKKPRVQGIDPAKFAQVRHANRAATSGGGQLSSAVFEHSDIGLVALGPNDEVETLNPAEIGLKPIEDEDIEILSLSEIGLMPVMDEEASADFAPSPGAEPESKIYLELKELLWDSSSDQDVLKLIENYESKTDNKEEFLNSLKYLSKFLRFWIAQDDGTHVDWLKNMLSPVNSYFALNFVKETNAAEARKERVKQTRISGIESKIKKTNLVGNAANFAAQTAESAWDFVADTANEASDAANRTYEKAKRFSVANIRKAVYAGVAATVLAGSAVAVKMSSDNMVESNDSTTANVTVVANEVANAVNKADDEVENEAEINFAIDSMEDAMTEARADAEAVFEVAKSKSESDIVITDTGHITGLTVERGDSFNKLAKKHLPNMKRSDGMVAIAMFNNMALDHVLRTGKTNLQIPSEKVAKAMIDNARETKTFMKTYNTAKPFTPKHTEYMDGHHEGGVTPMPSSTPTRATSPNVETASARPASEAPKKSMMSKAKDFAKKTFKKLKFWG